MLIKKNIKWKQLSPQGTKDYKRSLNFTVSRHFLPVSKQSLGFGSHRQAPVPSEMLLMGVLAESVGQHLFYTILQQVLGGLCDGIHWNHVSVTMQHAVQTNIVKLHRVALSIFHDSMCEISWDLSLNLLCLAAYTSDLSRTFSCFLPSRITLCLMRFSPELYVFEKVFLKELKVNEVDWKYI